MEGQEGGSQVRLVLGGQGSDLHFNPTIHVAKSSWRHFQRVLRYLTVSFAKTNKREIHSSKGPSIDGGPCWTAFPASCRAPRLLPPSPPLHPTTEGAGRTRPSQQERTRSPRSSEGDPTLKCLRCCVRHRGGRCMRRKVGCSGKYTNGMSGGNI